MTEAEWLACTDTRTMLRQLEGKASERKLGLFACTCCRMVWHLLSVPCRRIVEAVERNVELGTAPSELIALFEDYPHEHAQALSQPGGEQAMEVVEHMRLQLRWAQHRANWLDGYTVDRVTRSAAEALAKTIPWQQARRQQAQLLHEIFGPLPLRSVSPDLSWVTWNESTVSRLAHAIYEDRAFDHLPVLGDALEEAGCGDSAIIDHCRSQQPHVPGCWVVDLLTGRQ